jgi:hypothetical protein
MEKIRETGGFYGSFFVQIPYIIGRKVFLSGRGWINPWFTGEKGASRAYLPIDFLKKKCYLCTE